MNRLSRRSLFALAAATICRAARRHRSAVSILRDQFLINGKPTYQDRIFAAGKIQGLLLNARMVQGIFDDQNPATSRRWAYPDTGKWDPDRNTREFVASMPKWRQSGLLAFTINLQGGSPEGYSREQPWINTAVQADGSLRPDAMRRLTRILDRADDLGIAAIVGIFYFGQDQRIRDEEAVKRAVQNTVQWIVEEQGYTNVLLEIDNECDVLAYHHEILKQGRVHELILLAKETSSHILVGTSFAGGTIPSSNVVKASDFILLHGNGVSDPSRIAEMVCKTRSIEGYRPMPILFNEDDHFDFDRNNNNMLAAIGEYASWGYFDPGSSNYRDGYQCPPVNWDMNTDRKKDFFSFLKKVTGA